MPSSRGTPITLWGRASERTRTVMPATVQDRREPAEPRAAAPRRDRAGRRPPRWPRPPHPRPGPIRTPQPARRVAPPAAGRSQTPTGIARSRRSSGGQMNDIVSAGPAASGRPSGRSPPAGRRRSRGRRRRRPARRNDAARSASRRSAASPNRRRNVASWVSTYELLARLGVVEEHRPDVGQLGLAPVVQPDRDDLVLPGQALERALPAGRR